MPPKLYLMRHGQAEHNVAAALMGDVAYCDPTWKDAQLTIDGMDQCQSAAGELDETIDEFDAVQTSPLTRCVETAMIVTSRVPTQKFVASDALIERLGGGHICNERRRGDELRALQPTIDFTDVPDEPPVMEGREEVAAVRIRLENFINQVYAEQADTDAHILFVTHHDAVKALFPSVLLKNAQILKLDEN